MDQSNHDPAMIHVALPGGGIATVSAAAKPETLAALDRLLRAAATAAIEDELLTDEEGVNDVNYRNL